MRQQVVNTDEGDAGASPPAVSLKNRSPGGVCGGGGGSRVSPTMECTEETADDAVVVVEKIFPNGDIYTGEFVGNAPHGCGKCIWIDGCAYEGEWREGNAAGKGKFSWPSGASYDGEFKDGRMEGYGTFIGANGETYQGSWIADRKHGFGKKSYSNGDFYEGQWRRDLQEGQGRYVWHNGIQYVGEWRNGRISGRGVLILANGDLHDGQWENGEPRRSDVFAWPDCTCYLGSWSRDPKIQQQINGASASLASGKRPSIDRVFASTGEPPEIDIPGICMREFSSMLSEDAAEFGEGETAAGELQRRRSSCRLATDEAKKKPWPTIWKGHKSYDLVLNLQEGIRYSVGKASSHQRTNLRPSDFDPREKFWTKFPLEGSKIGRLHHSSDFRWKDYCPMVFRHLRKLFGVDPADYVKAICGADSLRELSSPGKSGSLFFQTQDGRFVIKTVRKCEVKILIKMLLNYHQHIRKFENSLLTKFYGVHSVKPIGGPKVRFIVMGNLLYSDHGIHRRFDLKGSSHGRSVYKSEEVVGETSTLKDLDLNFVFYLKKPWFNNFIWQIERDCEFLQAEGIMDYSLLVGIHFSDDLSASKMGTYSASQKVYAINGSFQAQGPLPELFVPGSGTRDTARRMDGSEVQSRLGAKTPARAARVFNGSNLLEQHPFAGGGRAKQPPSDKIYKVVLYFGIIDILRDYNLGKKLEHAYKALQVDPSSISAVDPMLYSKRFREFLGRVFVADD